MEIITFLNLLWARRIVVVLGALVAIAVGVLATQRGSSPSTSGAAVTARVLLDTRKSQLAAAAPAQADTLAMRAYLLAELMTTDRVRTLVAGQAGVPAGHLDILGPRASMFPPLPTPSSLKASTLATTASQAYALSLDVDYATSIISIEADAPDSAGAARLAAAGIGVLSSSLASQSTGNARAFVLQTVVAPHPKVVSAAHSRRRVLAIIGSFAIFSFCCMAVVLQSGIARGRRHPQPA